ncbi:protein abnormal spindle [Phlebotomus argentipes]|uniref:protein abnormal spindle n=1 Tax=Phlebotomus argentipes TaxID=94469 RepID=UPI002892D061|nr:protein abnormal spindle [Phlebotomus argentipes]
MSRFEIGITPTRVTLARKRDEAREETLVTMAPFSAKSTVMFDEIPVGKVARRVLLVENPTSVESRILVTKTCKPEFCIALEWTDAVIESAGKKTLEITWSPPKAVACREVIQFTDSRGFRKDVAVVLKSVEQRKGVKKPLRASNAPQMKRTKTKTPTPPRRVGRKVLISPEVVIKYKSKSPRLRKMISPTKKPRDSVKNKENQLPVTSPNISTLFDQINFTPVAVTKKPDANDIDYLASLPTPVAGASGVQRRFEWSPDEYDSIQSSVQQSIQPRQLLQIPEVQDCSRLSTETYVKGASNSKDSFEDCPEMGLEEHVPEIHKTFDVTKRIETHYESTEHISRQVDNIVLTPLRKIIASESMKNLSGQSKEQEFLKLNQGSMPNLHEIENINSIESNRYFFSGSEVETLSVNGERPSTIAFDANEIRAQSSRMNLHEVEPDVSPIAQVREDLFKVPVLKRRNDHIAMSNIEVRSSLMTLSPPKKYRPDDVCSTRASSADGLSMKSWSRYQPKKLKPLVLVKPKRSVTPKKEDREVTQIYDVNVLRYVNPDPFAATMTADPFLSATVFLDDEAVEKLEKHFKKWLNALVTVPEEFDGADQKIDVARLFNEVKNRELTLAPTKESVSAKYFIKYRLENLRKAASELYQRHEIQHILSHVTVLVEKKQLTIQQNRDLHKDIALQRQILELIFCFNPLWLRIGLEVVFNEKIELTSNRDIHGLTNFILNRLFRNKALEKKSNRSYIFTAEYGMKIKKFALKQLYLLIFLLDRAKQERIIRHNPCLFVKGARWKESMEIMTQVSSLLVTNVGDILRYLKRIGYVLEHKQTYLDEFNYAFSNLATDLRDGIRLTRVMEVILMREDLSRNLRYPAISLLQKRHNADVALLALSEAEFEIIGNITGKDIAEGHREKTLSLLWQIIYKFRAPKFNAAAMTIQRWWRNLSLKVTIRRRIAYRKEIVRHRAATVIQSAVRGYLTRRAYREYREERIVATIVIQTYYRRFAAQKNYARIRWAALTVQRRWKSVRLMRRERAMFLETRAAVMRVQRWFRRVSVARRLEAVARVADECRKERKLLNESAIVIQRAVKSYFIRKRLRDTVDKVVKFNRQQKLEYNAATAIQSVWRMRRVRRHFVTLRAATITIQASWRRCQLAKTEHSQFLKLRAAAVNIQRQWRAQLAMKEQKFQFLIIKQAALLIQRRFRARQAMKMSRHKFQSLKKSTIIVQRRFRANLAMKRAREEFECLKIATLAIQRRYRSKKLMLKYQFDFICLKESAITIQSFFRGYLLMKTQRKEFVQLRKATMILQSRFRANQLMKHHKSQYQELKRATRVIQARFRAKRIMKAIRGDFMQKKQAASVIQGRFRATRLMKSQRLEFIKYQYSTTVIQRYFRGWKMMKTERQKFLQIKSAAVIIQTRFRAQKSMKKLRGEFLKQKKAVICIQNWWRSTVAGRECRENFMNLRKSTVTIQRLFRGKLMMRKHRSDFQTLMKASVTIQRSWRAKVAMKKCREEFLQLKNSAIVFQRRFRAKKAMVERRMEYLKMKSAAEIIQRKWRATVVARKQRAEYLKLKNAAVIIQRRLRATLKMKECRGRFIQEKTACVRISIRWRAVLLMRQERRTYLELRERIVCLQSQWRAVLKMRQVKKEYETLKTATMTIQRRFRANRVMRIIRKEYSALKDASIVIQRRFRARKLMLDTQSDFLALKEATIMIQRRFREKKLTEITRKSFLVQKNAAITIQMHFRSFLEMRRHREEYRKLREVTVNLQRKYRAHLQMKKIRCQYLLIRSLVICLQRKFRAKIAMKGIRNDYMTLKRAAIFVQRRFREKLSSRRLREEFVASKEKIVKIQALARGFLARKRFAAMMSPEAIEMRRRVKAAKTIQAVWRGYVTRKKKQTASMKEIVEKIVHTRRNAKPTDTIRYHLRVAMRVLKGSFAVAELKRVLAKMENLSRTVPHILIPNARFVATFCCSVMAEAIRSEPHKLLIESCARVMLNLARYEHTVEIVFLPNAFTIIAQMLLRWCDKQSGIFNTLCTLIWVFIQDPRKNEKIREFMVTRDALFMAREIKKLVLRKENMKRNTQRVSERGQVDQQSLRKLPSLKPDYGVIRNQVYVFNCSIFAFDTILSKMDINLMP